MFLKIIGHGMLAVPFIGGFIWLAKMESLKVAFGIFGATALITLWILTAVYLITS